MYKLYWNTDTAAMAPQMVLEEAELEYETVPIDLKAGENFSSDYLAINPAGYIPALITEDGDTLTESAAICLYLCDRHGLTDLLPMPDDPARGRVYCRLFYLTNTVQEAYKRYYYPYRYSTDEADVPRIRDKAVEALIERWKLVDDHLAAAGPFHLGAAFSLADLYMVMLVTWFPPDRQALLDRYPAMSRAFDLAAERPAVRKVLEIHGDL